MKRTANCLSAACIVLFGAPVVALAATAPLDVPLDVPQLATGGNARGFDFVSFQFNIYLVGLGDPSGPSDYSANVLANDHENYTYLYRPSCGGSGRGGGYCRPRPYQRTGGFTYSDTYQNVSRPPTEIDATFHFSGADVVGVPLVFTVQDSGAYSLKLIEDATNVEITPGSPLSNGFYTLEYKTSSLLGSQLKITSAVPEPTPALLLMAGLWVVDAVRRRSAGANAGKTRP